MNSRDLLTLNMTTQGGRQIESDLAAIKSSMADLKLENDKLRTSIAQKKGEIGKVRNEIRSYDKELSKHEKTVSKAAETDKKLQARMSDLETAGKTGSKEWENLDRQINENISRMTEAQGEIARLSQARSKSSEQLSGLRAGEKAQREQIVENNRALGEQRKAYEKVSSTIRITDMTHKELAKRAYELRGQLNNTSKSLHPKEWNELNKQLIAVEKQQERVAAGAGKVKGKFDDLGNTVKKTLTLMLAYQALRFFTDLIGKAAEWVKAAPEVAAKTEGINRAFNKLNSPNLLKTLRTETKGLINDMLLMQSAVKADRFGIPINNLAKYLKFAQQRAQETGESIDYLTESIINGIGRKSPLILDNLGISAARLKAEMAGGATIVQATTKIVNEELAKQGDLALTTADKAKQASVKWENAQVALGKRMTWLSDLWSKVSGNMADRVAKMAGSSDTWTNMYDKQLRKVSDLEVNITPLIAKYEKLSKTVNINTADTTKLDKEQTELLDIVNQISTAVPVAKAAWDEHGRVIAINTEAAKRYITQQQLVLQYLNKQAIAQSKVDLVEANKRYNDQRRVVERGGFYENVDAANTEVFHKFTEDELVKQQELLSKLETETLRAYEGMRHLEGTSLDERKAIMNKETEQRETFNKMNEKQLKAWIDNKKNANSEYLKLAREIYSAKVGGNYGESGSGADNKASKKQQEELAAIDLWLTTETNRIKKEYSERLIAKQDYDEAMETAELEAINKRLALAGLDESKRADVERAFYDFKAKLREKEDSDEEKRAAEEQKNREQLEKWNEDETVKKIEAAVSAIDAQAEAERVALMEKYANGLIDEQDYQDKLLKIEADAIEKKLRINGASEEAITKLRKDALQLQIDTNEKARKNSEDTARAYADIGVGMAEQIGDTLTDFMQDSEASSAEFQYRMLMIALDTLRQVVLLCTAEAIAREIGTKGIAGIATGTAAAAAINVAFAAVKGLIKKPTSKSTDSSSESTASSGQIVVNGREDGGYVNVERSQDGKKFSALYDPHRRGFVDRPTVIVGEGNDSLEWVASNAATKNPTIAPIIGLIDEAQRNGSVSTIDLNQLMRSRLAGFDTGGFISRTTSEKTPAVSSDGTHVSNHDSEITEEMLLLLRTLNAKGVKANIGTTELQAQMKRDKEIDDLFTRK